MPQLIDNPDGTKSLTINSSELRLLRDRLIHHVPDAKKVVRFIEAPEVRTTFEFIKSALV